MRGDSVKERRGERNDRGGGVHRLFLSCDERGKIGATSDRQEERNKREGLFPLCRLEEERFGELY